MTPTAMVWPTVRRAFGGSCGTESKKQLVEIKLENGLLAQHSTNLFIHPNKQTNKQTTNCLDWLYSPPNKQTNKQTVFRNIFGLMSDQQASSEKGSG
jgi:predicted ATPase